MPHPTAAPHASPPAAQGPPPPDPRPPDPRPRADWPARLAEQRAAIEAVRTEVARQGRANWPQVFAAGSLGVSVLTVLGFLALEPLKESAAAQQAALRAIREDLREHLTAPAAHPAAAVRVGAVEADVAALRGELRRTADHTGQALRTERELSEAVLARRLDELERRVRGGGS